MPLRVPKTLRNPHALIRKTKEALKKARPSQYGMLNTWADGTLNVSVGPDSVDRALRIMNAIVKFMESQYLEVVSNKIDRRKITLINLFDETVSFGIKDRSRRYEREPSEKNHIWGKWYFVPQGQLTLFIDEGYGSGYKTNWSDAKKRKVEDLVSEFVVELVVTADAKRRRRQNQLERAIRQENERRRIAEINHQIEVESNRLKVLEQLAAQWTKSRHLKEFISAAECKAANRELALADQRQFELWLWWAKKHADRLDPLSRGLPQWKHHKIKL